jgi:hypothetical protein
MERCNWPARSEAPARRCRSLRTYEFVITWPEA